MGRCKVDRRKNQALLERGNKWRQTPGAKNGVDTGRILPTKLNQVTSRACNCNNNPSFLHHLQTMSSSPSDSQHAQKRSRDGDDSTGSKRPHLMLPQISEATDDKRIANSHRRKDSATMNILDEMEWDFDTVDTSLENQQFAADILHAVRMSHDQTKLHVHPDWAVRPNAGPEERISFLEKATYFCPRISEALLDAFKDENFKTIRNAGTHTILSRRHYSCILMSCLSAFFQRPYVGPPVSKPMENAEITGESQVPPSQRGGLS